MQVQGAYSGAVQASAATPMRAASVTPPQSEMRVHKMAAPVVPKTNLKQIDTGLSLSQYAGSQVSVLPKVDIDVQRFLSMTAQLLNQMQATRAYGSGGSSISQLNMQA
ncbi:MAG: hypothetical protein GWP08_07075 [Nitrospiraceae bacterium]|nr:hypothetical protein [Nitrospiraceae bacterium]